jgi:hypothetical protein
MTPLLVVLLSLPCVYWTEGIESRAMLQAAGIKRVCVAPEQAETWRAAGFSVTPIAAKDLASRDALPTPGTTARPGMASPTRSPWINASGWRFTRSAGRKYKRKYKYDVPAGKAALAAAEAFAYGVDAVVKAAPADLEALGAMLTFLEGLPNNELPAVADLAVVDDGSAITGEVMNLLARRNLLFQVVQSPSARFRINIAMGSPEYPLEAAADPSAFAQKIRAQLTDDQRSLRIYGSEVVIGRLTGTAERARLHLLNYGGREIEGLRLRVRGAYREGEAYVAGAGRLALQDYGVADGATEFSLPRLANYAVIDLKAR